MGFRQVSHPAQLLHLLLVLVRQPLQQLFGGGGGLDLERGAKLPRPASRAKAVSTFALLAFVGDAGRGTRDNERARTIGVMSSSSNSAPISSIISSERCQLTHGARPVIAYDAYPYMLGVYDGARSPCSSASSATAVAERLNSAAPPSATPDAATATRVGT